MLNFLPPLVLGIIASVLFGLNVLIWPMLVFAFSILKFLLPFSPLRRLLDRILLWLAENWISCNSGWMRLTQKTKWDVQGLEGLNYHGWYLVISNHQSWVDIFVMQHLLNRRIPLMKFFLKQELIWVPVMGIAWWALDFPFLRRHGVEYLKKHPEQKGKDFATTRKACEKFAHTPTSVMNFLEGTRFSKARHARQQSPYKHLLRPKAGGMALALDVLGEKTVEGVKIKFNDSGKEETIPAQGYFAAIGHTPNTKLFAAAGIEVDPKGYIAVKNYTRTNIEGVFVAGDVQDFRYRQAVSAAGMGCMVEKYLAEQE